MTYMYHCSHSYNRNMAPFIVRSHGHVAYHTDRKLQPHHTIRLIHISAHDVYVSSHTYIPYIPYVATLT